MPHRRRPDAPCRRPRARRSALPPLFGGLALALLAFAASCGGGNQPSPGTGEGWRLTVYYTPVESYHGGSREPISACQGADLGSHSHEFLTTIKTEGFGRLSTPVESRSYLGWDFARRCWFLAAAPVGANDRPLRAWVSTAGHPSIAIGTRVSVRKCGGQVDRSLCDRVRAAAWVVDDRCSVGCTGPKHLDLYIGEEDRPKFEDDSPNYFEDDDATVTLTR